MQVAEPTHRAEEADVLNVAIFGMTAKEWRENNPDLEGNIRDDTDILHLIVLSNFFKKSLYLMFYYENK